MHTKYMYQVNRFKSRLIAQEESVARWTGCPDMTVAFDWDVLEHQTKMRVL